MSPSYKWSLAGLLISVACSEPRSTTGDAASSPKAEPALQVIADAEASPGCVALDERYVYWTSSHALRRAAHDGSGATTLASGDFRHIAAADGGVYATAYLEGKVYRFNRESGDANVVGSGEYPDGIAVHGDNVYWTNTAMVVGTGTLARASLDGQNTELLADGLASPGGVAADGDFVYFASGSVSCGQDGCNGGGITKLSLRDKSVEVFDLGISARDVVLGVRGAYWVSDPGIFRFVSFDGHKAEKLADATGDGEGPIAVDADAVYLGSANRGRVLKVKLDGGEPQPIVTDLGAIGGIALDRDWLYVASNTQGRILRVAKDGSAAKPSAPITGPCVMPLGAAEEIAATPRADVNLELLALSLDPGRITASEEAYARIVADVTAIRKAEPTLANIAHFPRSDGRQLLLGPNDLTMESIRAGDYHAWDCLNEFYGLEDIEIGSTYVVVALKGTYDIIELGKLYKQLPGIQSAGSNLGGNGPTICAGRNGSTFEYVVDRASGDCPAGCITHEVHAFVSSAPGNIEARGVWNSDTNKGDPALFRKLCRR